MTLTRPDVMVLDMEGTMSSTWFAPETLYPYSRDRFAQYLDEHSHNPAVARSRRETVELAGLGEHASTQDVVAALQGWSDAGEKPRPLTRLNDIIWQSGFASGEFQSHFFEDVVPALHAWRNRGILLYVYSTRPVPAQRAWFKHSPEGNLLPLISGHFDLETAGPKDDVSSYRNIGHDIAEVLGKPKEHVLYLSDRRAELDAAREHGWQTVGVSRPGQEHSGEDLGEHPVVDSLERVQFGSVHHD